MALGGFAPTGGFVGVGGGVRDGEGQDLGGELTGISAGGKLLRILSLCEE